MLLNAFGEKHCTLLSWYERFAIYSFIIIVQQNGIGKNHMSCDKKGELPFELSRLNKWTCDLRTPHSCQLWQNFSFSFDVTDRKKTITEIQKCFISNLCPKRQRFSARLWVSWFKTLVEQVQNSNNKHWNHSNSATRSGWRRGLLEIAIALLVASPE